MSHKYFDTSNHCYALKSRSCLFAFFCLIFLFSQVLVKSPKTNNFFPDCLLCAYISWKIGKRSCQTALDLCTNYLKLIYKIHPSCIIIFIEWWFKTLLGKKEKNMHEFQFHEFKCVIQFINLIITSVNTLSLNVFNVYTRSFYHSSSKYFSFFHIFFLDNCCCWKNFMQFMSAFVDWHIDFIDPQGLLSVKFHNFHMIAEKILHICPELNKI